MKNFLKSIWLCLGLIVLNQDIFALVSIVGMIFLKDSNKINEYTYIIVFVGHVITLILLQLIYSIYGKKLLSKKIIKNINFKYTLNITLFGIGLSIILQSLTQILIKIIPSYI